MSRLPDRITPLMADPKAEPWVRFCAQCIDREHPCVMVLALEAPPGAPCEKGEHFVYDADGHGLLPRDWAFSIALHRLAQEALRTGEPSVTAVPTGVGGVRVAIEPYRPGHKVQ